MHLVDLPRWAVERGERLNAFSTLDPARTALVNIDMQTAFVAEGHVFGNAHARDIVEPVNRLTRALRVAGASVIWTRQTYSAMPPFAPPDWQYDLGIPEVRRAVEALQAGAEGHRLYAEMEVAPGDIVLDKHRYGALSCPAGALARTLGELRAQMVVIAGTLTNCCCESTAREANMAGYKVILVSDATAAVTDDEHNAALLNLRINFADVKTVEQMLDLLNDQSLPSHSTLHV